MNAKALQKSFPLTSICRADLREFLTDEQIATLDDCDMEYIAKKMADAYCTMGFWIDLEIIAQDVIGRK